MMSNVYPDASEYRLENGRIKLKRLFRLDEGALTDLTCG